MQPSQLEASWRQHLNVWRASDLSQNAYCREHALKSHQFSYWKRKLATTTVDHNSRSCEKSPTFVPLHVRNSTPTDHRLCLRLPNGFELSGIEAQHLPVITRLIEVLR